MNRRRIILASLLILSVTLSVIAFQYGMKKEDKPKVVSTRDAGNERSENWNYDKEKSSYRFDDKVIDEELIISIPQDGLTYTLKKESDVDGFTDMVPNGDVTTNEKFKYIASIGAVEEIDRKEHFQSVFQIYKLDLPNKVSSLSSWLRQLEKLNLPEEATAHGEVYKSSVESIQKNSDSELLHFYWPEPSDNGWYVYNAGRSIYFFSMGNSSYAVNGMKNGLWDTMMRTLRTAETKDIFSLEVPSDWKKYVDPRIGLEFSYPADWKIIKGNSGVALNSPDNQQTMRDIESGKMYGEGYMSSISVRSWKTPAEEDENRMNNLGAKTVAEMINANFLISHPERVRIKGDKYWAATRGGFGAYYTVFIDENSRYFEIMSGYKEKGDDLDETERAIISSMSFR
ncbi:MAG: hypothetical protein ACEQSB_01345 [Undibacterium sp.]